MSKINLKLEPEEDAEAIKEKFVEAGLIDVELYNWQRHAVNEILKITKYTIPETQAVMVSVFAESGKYLPTHEELMTLKEHFLPAKIVNIKCEYAVAGDGTMIVPLNVEILEWTDPRKAKPIVQIPKTNTGIIGLNGKPLVN